MTTMAKGWDRPKGQGKYHWYDGASAICGSDAPLSRVTQRTKKLPGYLGVTCKKCLRALRVRTQPVLRVVA